MTCSTVQVFYTMAYILIYQVFLIFFKLNAFSVICAAQRYPDASRIIHSVFDGLTKEDIKHFSTLPFRPIEEEGWSRPLPFLGQVVGVGITPNHHPVILHRGPRVWDGTTFNESHHFQYTEQGPILEDTLVVLDADNGDVLVSWGSEMFYLPHGLTLDRYGNYYVTDVALHQVFKFRPGSRRPKLTFGKKFEPGSGAHHLCKPTDVAVAATGEIFISDGYCNSRILKYDSNGNLLNIIPENQAHLILNVPHSITLIEDLDVLCIADRENKRIVCPGAGLKNVSLSSKPVLTIQNKNIGRIFGIAMMDNKLIAVNGPSEPEVPITGLTVDPITRKIIDYWTTKEGLQNPHAIAACPYTSSIYITEIGPNRIWKFRAW